jgi:hypothetical protein
MTAHKNAAEIEQVARGFCLNPDELTGCGVYDAWNPHESEAPYCPAEGEPVPDILCREPKWTLWTKRAERLIRESDAVFGEGKR